MLGGPVIVGSCAVIFLLLSVLVSTFTYSLSTKLFKEYMSSGIPVTLYYFLLSVSLKSLRNISPVSSNNAQQPCN